MEQQIVVVEIRGRYELWGIPLATYVAPGQKANSSHGAFGVFDEQGNRWSAISPREGWYLEPLNWMWDSEVQRWYTVNEVVASSTAIILRRDPYEQPFFYKLVEVD